MQLGIPVVADMTPESCQFLQHGRTGFLAHSAEGWYDAIASLRSSAELRQEIAGKAKSWFDERFDRKEIAGRLLEQIVALAEKKRRGIGTPRIEIDVRRVDHGSRLRNLWQDIRHFAIAKGNAR
jgi:hypothetical protein